MKSNYKLSWAKVINLCLFLVGLVLYFWSDWYWSNVCAVLGCEIHFLDAYLAPLREFGLVLAGTVLPFLFLPTWYFKKWLKYFAPYIFIITLATFFSIDPYSSNMFNDTREEAMHNYIQVWFIVSIIFIAYQWYRNRKK